MNKSQQQRMELVMCISMCKLQLRIKSDCARLVFRNHQRWTNTNTEPCKRTHIFESNFISKITLVSIVFIRANLSFVLLRMLHEREKFSLFFGRRSKSYAICSIYVWKWLEECKRERTNRRIEMEHGHTKWWNSFLLYFSIIFHFAFG